MRKFKVGDRIYVIPRTRYSWEYPAPHGVQIIADLNGLKGANPYIIVKDDIHDLGLGYLVERCLHVDNLSELEKVIYDFEP